MIRLSPRQHAALTFVAAQQRQGQPVTVQRLAAHLGVSTARAGQLLTVLVQRRYLAHPKSQRVWVVLQFQEESTGAVL